MPRIVSVVLDHLGFFNIHAGGLAVHGANLVVSAQLHEIARRPEVEGFEIFLAPYAMTDPGLLRQSAEGLMPADRMGRGILRFYPMHAMPDIWRDGEARLMYTVDPENLPRDRYLRDRFAEGPTPIVSTAHALGHAALWPKLQRLAEAPPVSYDAIVAPSRSYAAALEKAFDGYLGATAQCRIEVIPHGIDGDRFRPVDEAGRTAARRELELPEGATIALVFGRLTPNNKADLSPLLRVFAEVSQPEDRLVLAGEENIAGYLDRLAAEASELGIGDRVTVRGRVDPDRRERYFQASDLFVFPGDTLEAFATTVTEALACGLPCIVSDWAGLRDQVVDGDNGFCVPTWFVPGLDRVGQLSPANLTHTEFLYLAQSVWVDTRGLGESLATLLRSTEDRQRMGQRSRAIFDERFRLEHVFDRLFALFDEMIELARREGDESKAERRSHADKLGLPTPYISIFGAYATHVLNGEVRVRPTKHGNQVLRKQASLTFYDECLPLLRPDIFGALLERLGALNPITEPDMSFGSLVSGASFASNAAEDDVRFHAALLLKRGVMELVPIPAKG
ncbi:MAG: glycosyltransferase family 4 protein [Fimbriimonas ginsengisoli]|uniref:Glycosyltransferase family 4 protein n=1 Tax=Fimbriimonas ginsengisoli TaxID=1005039 RepID=A0A931LQN5_FIMGI|nr:glycosyltransferase family 4 protein [Fimbriimonas ginsengisoli]